MGQALSSVVSCCCTEPARDSNDTEFIEVEVCYQDEQPWKEKIKTNEKIVVIAVDPKFCEEKIAKGRLEVITNLGVRKLALK